jgi:hypothetical protein
MRQINLDETPRLQLLHTAKKSRPYLQLALLHRLRRIEHIPPVPLKRQPSTELLEQNAQKPLGIIRLQVNAKCKNDFYGVFLIIMAHSHLNGVFAVRHGENIDTVAKVLFEGIF